MGRKRKRIVRTRPIPTLPMIFDCPLCGTSKSVQIDIDQKLKLAFIKCGKCHYESSPRQIKSLDERVDIYGDWLDELSAKEGKSRIKQPITTTSNTEEE